MKRFEFRLQTSLDIAVRQEQLAREEMLMRIKERDQVAEELDMVNTRLHNLEEEIRRAMKEAFSMERMLLHRNYIPVLKRLRDDKNRELSIAEERVEEARRLVIERVKETKTLTRLKEKEWQAYRLELLREEQKGIDEVATTRYYRQVTSNSGNSL